jgi:DNA-binding MurR/RpiR family transcriptional regulator
MLAHLGDLAVYNSSELASLSGVSKATVSRLLRRLGFESSQEVKDHLRALRTTGVPVSTAGVDGSGTAHEAHRRSEAARLDGVLERLGGGVLEAIAADLALASRVLVIGHRNSYPVALHLRGQLMQARGNVHLAPQPGQTIGEEIAGLSSEDVVVVVGFRRRPQSFRQMMVALESSPALVILLADPTARNLASLANHYLECAIEGPSPFDSYAAPMSAISLIAGEVLATVGRTAHRRVDEIGRLYGVMDEIELLD